MGHSDVPGLASLDGHLSGVLFPTSTVRVRFFTDGPSTPGSRFRCLQLFPHLERCGIECSVRYAYDQRYNDVFDRPWAPLYKFARRLRRAGQLLVERDFDVLFLHKTAFAFSPLPEWLRGLGRKPIIFDFDDAIHVGSGPLDGALRETTFRGVVGVADYVIAGNSNLAAASAVPGKTTVIPSVIDTDRYVPAARAPGPELVVGWIGTASNFPSLRSVLPQVLRAVELLPRARLRVVSNGVLPEYARHPRVEQWRWNEAQELAALQSFDVGLMPLVDTEQTRGKCGFKMIQYMATGVPVVASAVGANPEIFRDSGAGRLVEPGGDWVSPIVELASDAALRRTLGEAGRRHAVAHYSVRAVLPQYLALLRAAGALGQARQGGPRLRSA